MRRTSDAEDGVATATTPIGHHARRATGTSHGTSASVTGAFQRLDSSVTGSFAALTDADLRPIATPAAATAAPQPISVDPAVTSSFERITPETAAAHATREGGNRSSYASARRLRHADRPVTTARRTAPARLGGKAIAGIAVATMLVVALVGALVGALMHRAFTSIEDAGSDAPATQVDPTGALTVADTTYTLADNGDGTHALCASADGGGTIAVALINGDPAQLLTYNGSVIVPESYGDDTWDVIAYTPGGDALAAQVVDGDGTPVHGSGTIEDARLDGSDLVIVDSTGATTTVSLGA